MEKDRLIDLFDRYMTSESSDEERQELFAYIIKSENAGHVQNLLKNALNKESGENKIDPELQNSILSKIFDSDQHTVTRTKTKSLSWFKVAAAIVFIVGASIFIIKRDKGHVINLASNTSHSVIRPGGNKAVLILGNGQKINLNDQRNGTIGYQGNASVVKLTNGELAYATGNTSSPAVVYNTMATPRGGKYNLILADGTKVWLNAASSITYPTAFNGQDRTVNISGEAYFEVAHDKNKPFKVNVLGQIVEVLGTHFNIDAYADESELKTTLLEGKVKVSKGTETEFLRPGQQSVVRQNQNGISVKDVDTEDAIAWKNGFTTFKNADIQGIMRQISRWYDIDVVFNGDVSSQRIFTGEISRTAELADVLKVLELNDIHFRFNKNKLIVSP